MLLKPLQGPPATLVNPPGPRTWSPFGKVFEFRRNPPDFLMRMHREYGDIVRFRMRNTHAYLLANPDYVRDLLLQNASATVKSLALRRAKSLLGEGLLTSEPPLHTRQRRLMQPAFHQERILNYGRIMVSTGEEWLRRWHDRHLENGTFDLHSEMMQLTLSIVTRSLFSSDVAPVTQELSEITNLLVGMFPYLISPFGEHVEHWPLPISRRYRAARQRLNEMIYGLIAERRTQEGPDDLLSMLLSAQDQEADHGKMTDTQIRDELVTLFLAGHETTANALTWTWYLLSQHPEVEARFHQELKDELPSRLPDPSDFQRLRYTTAVFSESLRLYPPAWGVSRIAKKDIEIGGYTIPAESMCIVSQRVMHRDARLFSEPDRFLPERWLNEAPPKQRFAYFPFGAGSRMCIGERFAWMEGVLLLALLGQKWRFRLAPQARVIPEALITLRPKFGLPVQAETCG